MPASPAAAAPGDFGRRAQNLGLDPAAFLADNDSTGVFMGIADLLNRRPTVTISIIFRAIGVDRP
jgi:hydroxypyruvate reductase